MLLVAPEPFYEPRGTPMNVLQMCRVLTGAGYRVDLATYPLGESPELPGLVLHRCLSLPGLRSVPVGFSKRKLLLDLLLFFTLLKLLIRRRYAVVHAVEEAVFLVLPFTWLGVRLIYDLDSLISDQLRYTGVLRGRRLLAGVRRLERLALARSAAAVTVCRSLSEAARGLYSGTPIFQVEDSPLEESLREPDPERVEALRSEQGLTGRRVAVYTGNLESYQGIDLLLAAVPALRRELPSAVLVLVGGEPAQVETLRAQLRREGLEGLVVAVGRRPPEEMPEWMGLADALVSPRTEGENTPLKIYTYMRSGRPIVATDLPTHTQVLDSSTALLCPPTPQGLAAALIRALSDPGPAHELTAAARLRAESEYSFAAFRRKLLAAYDAVLPEDG